MRDRGVRILTQRAQGQGQRRIALALIYLQASGIYYELFCKLSRR